MWNSDLRIEFIVPKRGRGDEDVFKIAPLSIRAESLRFVDILLLNPVYIKVQGVKVLVPSPESFCLHKFAILNRRQKIDKRTKDLEQAVYTYRISDKNKLLKMFHGLLRPWQKTLIENLNHYIDLSPLLREEIREIIDTLQNAMNKTK